MKIEWFIERKWGSGNALQKYLEKCRVYYILLFVPALML